MTHPIHRVLSFQIMDDYVLRVDFDDSVSRVIDFEPVLRGELYGPLRAVVLFNQVRVDPEAHTLLWPNGADFDPATLHDWPDLAKSFEAMALGWESDAASERSAHAG